VSERTARKWLARWRAEGEAGLVDRSSAPKVVANRTSVQTEALIGALRRDLIGKTREQLRAVHFRRDRDWLQS
jgi:transposase